MKNGVDLIVPLIVYSLLFLLCMWFSFYSYLKFKFFVKKSQLVSLMDKLYESIIWVVAFLFLAIYIAGTANVFLNINLYDYQNLPFAILAMPLTIIILNTLINEGLHAYSNNAFLRGKRLISKENISIKSVKKSILNRVKITITVDNASRMKDRQFVIRTSLVNLQPFLDIYGD